LPSASFHLSEGIKSGGIMINLSRKIIPIITLRPTFFRTFNSLVPNALLLKCGGRLSSTKLQNFRPDLVAAAKIVLSDIDFAPNFIINCLGYADCFSSCNSFFAL